VLLTRLLLVLGALGLAFGAWILWRRTPRVSRMELGAIGTTGPAIVQFGTPDCGPCRRARPVLERLARDAGVEYVDVDLEERPDLASRYRIRAVPFVLVTGRDGVVFGRWTGVPPDDEVRRLATMARAA
jgi:thioredoxin-like negative regulator of GroEL